MTLKRIRLELARTPEFPNGSSHHGYEFTAPLDAKGHLDPGGWFKNKVACTVHRFWEKADDEAGTLIHRRDGKWAAFHNRHRLRHGDIQGRIRPVGKYTTLPDIGVDRRADKEC